MFNFKKIGTARTASLDSGDALARKIGERFPKFLTNRARVYIIKLSSAAADYPPETRGSLKKMILQALNAGEIKSPKLADLLVVAQTAPDGTIDDLVFIDRDMVDDHPELWGLLLAEQIAEIVL